MIGVSRKRIGKDRVAWIEYMRRWHGSEVEFLTWTDRARHHGKYTFPVGSVVLRKEVESDGKSKLIFDPENSHQFRHLLESAGCTSRELMVDLREGKRI